MPHGNHDPKYGGVVLMNGDLHFEVVLRPDGRHQVYFSDAIREELPASIASSVDVTVTRPGVAPETVTLHIDESGESWTGRGRPVDDPAQTTARIAYTVQATPYWIDVPFMPAPSRPPRPAQKMTGRGRPTRRPGADPRVRPDNVSASTFSSYGVNPVS